MGHWSTYRRRGGGPPAIPPNNFIETAQPSTSQQILVTYHYAVDAASFDVTDFHTFPANAQPTSIAQFDSTDITLLFIPDIDEEDSLNYTGDTPFVESPQSVDLD